MVFKQEQEQQISHSQRGVSRQSQQASPQPAAPHAAAGPSPGEGQAPSPSYRPFTVSGGPELDRLIEHQLSQILDELRSSLPEKEMDALILGGGYGRGEGGALSVGGEMRPYNDYDLVLVHHVSDQKLLRQTLAEVHEECSRRFGVHVDVTPIRRTDLSGLPPALTWFELQKGHRVLFGETEILREMGQRTLSHVHESEWGRLLFNRGSGVLFAIWLLEGKRVAPAQGESFEAFTTRQVEKAWLSLGDVMLAREDKYQPSVVARREAFAQLVDLPAWAENYFRAVEFKHRPVLERDRVALIDELGTLAALYAKALSKSPASKTRPLVSLYSTARRVPPSRWLLSRPWRYPRERLKLALAAELSGNAWPRRRLVGTPNDYVKLWEQYS